MTHKIANVTYQLDSKLPEAEKKFIMNEGRFSIIYRTGELFVKLKDIYKKLIRMR